MTSPQLSQVSATHMGSTNILKTALVICLHSALPGKHPAQQEKEHCFFEFAVFICNFLVMICLFDEANIKWKKGGMQVAILRIPGITSRDSGNTVCLKVYSYSFLSLIHI